MYNQHCGVSALSDLPVFTTTRMLQLCDCADESQLFSYVQRIRVHILIPDIQMPKQTSLRLLIIIIDFYKTLWKSWTDFNLNWNVTANGAGIFSFKAISQESVFLLRNK